MAFDEAKEQLLKGNEVWLLVCDQTAGICIGNIGAVNTICRLCIHTLIPKCKELEREFPGKVHIEHLKDYITAEIRKKAEEYSLVYQNVKELKGLQYEGIEIGYAAFSTYVSYTRNIAPTFNDFLKNYLNYLMRSSIRITEGLKVVLDRISPEFIVAQNGRHTNQKPFLQLAQQRGIDYVMIERQWSADNMDLKDYFYNDIPHSAKAVYNKMLALWGEGGKDKEEIATRFFKNRRYGKFAGDKIYTLNQKEGELPVGFDEHIRNIAIFNSSEDEYYSISKEHDESGLYPNQFTALKDIFEHFKGNNHIHFYLRIHPNLAVVPWKSHTDLYKLKYDNVTIIPPKDSVSSYALMDKCEKVVIFNSTMGLESTYWDKPVISLAMDYFTYMDITYIPKSKDELYELLTTDNLKSKKNVNCLKAAHFIMRGGLKPFKYYRTKAQTEKFLGVNVNTSSQFSLLGSPRLLGFALRMLRGLAHRGFIGKFSQIPLRTK